MAITRAQQVRQMLEDGGMLVQPSMTGKRPGYRGPGGYQGSDPDTGSGGASKGPSGGGSGGNGGNDNGGNGGNQNTGNAREDYITNYVSKSKVKGGGLKKIVDRGDGPVYDYSDVPLTPTQINNARKFKEEQDKKRSRTIFGTGFNLFPIATTVFNKLSNSRLAKYNNLLQRNNYLRTLPPAQQVAILERLAEEEEIGTTNPMGIDRNIQRGMGTYDYMDPEKVDKGFLGTGIGAGKLVTDIEFGGKDAKDVINEVTDGGYDDYLDRNKTEDRDDRGDPFVPTVLTDDTEDEDEDDTNTGGLAFRFMSRGGSPMDAPTEGGIMDLETGRQMYFLGKLVKKATRAVKKIAKSPIGKAALLYGAGTLGAGFLGQAKAGTGLGGLIKGKLLGLPGVDEFGGSMGLLRKLGLTKGGFGTFGGLTGKGMFSAGALALTPLLFGQQEDDEEGEFYRGPGLDIPYIRGNPYTFRSRIGDGTGLMTRAFQDGGSTEREPVAKKTMPLLDMDGKEMDLREDGGFVPIGRMEKADDVPARLSKNEFVFTADAVRNAGEGDVDKGAEVMYNMMKNLESGGEVSEESQGLSGAREMFQTSKRLEEVL
jgi:hypothetical protein